MYIVHNLHVHRTIVQSRPVLARSPRSCDHCRSGPMDFEQREDHDGVRLSWNCAPKSRIQHQRNVIPLASMYTPLNSRTEVLQGESLEATTCRQCAAFVNPYVTITEQQPDVYYCQFCGFANRIAAPVSDVVGLRPEATTVEYRTGRTSSLPPIFMYVVDTCFQGEDVEDAFGSLRELLQTSLSLLPENSLVGLISFGKHVLLHEFSSHGVPRIHCFNGDKRHSVEEIQKALGILAAGLRSNSKTADAAALRLGSVGVRFLQPVSVVEYEFSTALENLVTNLFPFKASLERPARAVGAAVNVASTLLKSILGDSTSVGGHLMCFIGGPCTFGPGKVVGSQLKEPFRSHHDIERAAQSQLPSVPQLNATTKVNLTLSKDAKKFYEDISTVLIALGISCDFFVGSYDQLGFYEVDDVCSRTGGVVIMCDSFNTSIFKLSFAKFFKQYEEGPDVGYLEMGFNSTLECRVTSDLRIEGLIGNATSLPPRKNVPHIEKSIAKTVVGEGGTNTWKLCSTNTQLSYAIYFDKMDSVNLGHSYIQYLYHYQHPSGELRLRVTTVQVAVVPDADMQSLEAGFDQEAAVVLIARDCVNKLRRVSGTTHFEQGDVVKQLDQLLVDFCARVAVYTKGAPKSFRLSSTYSFLPQFLYHLRRSNLIRVFNNSPDETSYLRHIFMQQDVNNSLIIIQPTLLSYDVETYTEDSEPEPVLLDSMSLGPDKILLLDSFFQVLIYHGSRVAQWRKAGYQDMEGYEHFKLFLEAPKREAMDILVDRFPLPRFIDCDDGGSQARFLMAKLNPSTTYATNPNHLYGGQLDVLTDDLSLQLYMDHTQNLIVTRK